MKLDDERKSMVVIESIDKIVSYENLLEEESSDFKAYFESHDARQIIELANDKYCTYQQLARGVEPADIRVKYCPDMFLMALPIIALYGYAVADDENGNHIAVLTNKISPYVHRYKYAGGLDLWLLDRYDCIFLHGCNEYSVELCKTALRLWKGQRLILVGADWEPMIPMLPDLPGVDCYYEAELLDDRFAELIEDRRFLQIIFGIPHSESMERYNMGIMYYDEIMSFTFMFSDYQELGEENPDKNFFMLDGYYGGVGLFILLSKVEACARYAKSKGFIPIIQIKKSGSFYQNIEGDDIWQKFFNQPEDYSVEEVMTSKHVFFSPGFYNGSVQSTIMSRETGENVTLPWPQGVYNQRVAAYIKERQKRFLPFPEKTLGVLARGTDYVNTHLPNHPIHASKEMIGEKIDEVWESWGGFKYIYIVFIVK